MSSGTLDLSKSVFGSENAEAELPAIMSSAEWVDYFRSNNEGRLAIPWDSGAGVSSDELSRIASSLQSWQLGETSDGSRLMATIRKYAVRMKDPDSIEAIRMFILEEQRHGELLGRFLDLAGTPRARHDWGDSLFRAFRHLVPRMEIWVTPVVMLEAHALIYYNAIRLSTNSPVLQLICKQLLIDEIPHIRFQCERLAILHRHRPWLMKLVTMLAHRIFFTGITMAIWVGHRQAYRAGGYPFSRFWKAAWGKMNRAWRLMDPSLYRW
jgi:hypothetical protein